MSSDYFSNETINRKARFHAIKREFYFVMGIVAALFAAVGFLYHLTLPVEKKIDFPGQIFHVLPGQEFAMEINMEEITGEETLSVFVKRRTLQTVDRQAMIVISSGKFWRSVETVTHQTGEGWEILADSIKLTGNLLEKRLKIYCWNPAGGEYNFADYQVVITRPGKLSHFVTTKETP